MAQCGGRSERTGERCKSNGDRRARARAHYHREAAGQVSRHAAVGPSRKPWLARRVAGCSRRRMLSKRTCDDFETLFAVGTGWGRCGCLFALDARRSTRGGTWAEQREVNLAHDARARRTWPLAGDPGLRRRLAGGLVSVRPEGRAALDRRGRGRRGVVRDVLRRRPSIPRARRDRSCAARSGQRDQPQGAAASSRAMPRRSRPGPPPKPERKGAHVEGDVLFYGGSAKVRFGVEVEGVGPVTALYRSRRSMHGAPLGGTVDLFRREGFEAVAVLPRPTSGRAALNQPDRIVMRRTV